MNRVFLHIQRQQKREHGSVHAVEGLGDHRWDIGLVDITGNQGLLAQVNGRTSGSVTDWFGQRDE